MKYSPCLLILFTWIALRDAPIPKKRPIPILIFFRGPIPIPVYTESETWTGKAGFQNL